MKYLCLLILLVFTWSCKCRSTAINQNDSKKNAAVCPDNGVCSLKVLENKSLAIKTDGLGAIYIEPINGENVVLKFEYRKNDDKNLADSSYREEVFMELNPNDFEVETNDLSSRKLYFARWCYCKGQTGFYKINDGLLKVAKLTKGSFQLHLSFEIDEVPQVITQINETFSLQ